MTPPRCVSSSVVVLMVAENQLHLLFDQIHTAAEEGNNQVLFSSFVLVNAALISSCVCFCTAASPRGC